KIAASKETEVKSIHVSIRDQQLTVSDNGQSIRTYPISTSRFGIGTEEGSFKTPTGRFCVAKKIGGDTPSNTIFVGRVPLEPSEARPSTEDLVMSRILWLDGLDEHNANTRNRFIYIHGTKHEDRIGAPASHGCVRMRNADVVELFELVDEGTAGVVVGGVSGSRGGGNIQKTFRKNYVFPWSYPSMAACVKKRRSRSR